MNGNRAVGVIKKDDAIYMKNQREKKTHDLSFEDLKKIGSALEGAQSNAAGQERSFQKHVMEFLEMQERRIRLLEEALLGAN